MDAETESYEQPARAGQIARKALPWLALLVVVFILWNIGAGFVSSQRAASAAAQASLAASAAASATAAATTTTTGTAFVAKVQSDVSLMSKPNSKSEKVATAKAGATLTVLESQSAWMRVKDAAGHIGWIPNDKRYIVLQTK
jgi:Flp pilus assembly protein TadG